MSNEFTEYLVNAGTVQHLTVYDSPSSTGAAEQANQTHMDGDGCHRTSKEFVGRGGLTLCLDPEQGTHVCTS